MIIYVQLLFIFKFQFRTIINDYDRQPHGIHFIAFHSFLLNLLTLDVGVYYIHIVLFHQNIYINSLDQVFVC